MKRGKRKADEPRSSSLAITLNTMRLFLKKVGHTDKRKVPTKEKEVLVILNPRDASQDYYLPQSRAAQLYKDGKLQWDLTNSAYCVPNKVKVI